MSCGSVINLYVFYTFQLQPGGWRKPLSMGNESSETHDRFRAQPAMPTEPNEFVVDPKGFNLSNHHTDGPSKVKNNIV